MTIKQEILKMKNELGISNELNESETEEYLKIKNAYNLHQINKGVKFFVALATVGIAAGIIIWIISLL